MHSGEKSRKLNPVCVARRRPGCLRVSAVDKTVDSDAGLEIEEQAVSTLGLRRQCMPASVASAAAVLNSMTCCANSMTCISNHETYMVPA